MKLQNITPASNIKTMCEVRRTYQKVFFLRIFPTIDKFVDEYGPFHRTFTGLICKN